MRVWLVKAGEPLPLTENERIMRMGLIANTLHARGHQVVWWTSTFDHARRVNRRNCCYEIEVDSGYKIRMLYSPGYKRSLSLQRVWDHFLLGRQFHRAIQKEIRPDVILCALPTLELAACSTRYGTANNIPVVLDLRDMWPDIFLEHISAQFSGVAKVLLRPLFCMAKEACSSATALIGITDHFVEWGLKYAGRSRTDLDRVFPLAYSRTVPKSEAIEAAWQFWKRHGIYGDSNERLIFCFFGTIGHQLDMETVIRAARMLQDTRSQFVLCGDGDNLAYYKQLSRDCENVVFPGWIGAAEIWTLMQISTAGLAPYKSSPSFVRSIPNKAVEYLAGGLPIITSLEGSLKSLVEERSCGFWYPNGGAEILASYIHTLCSDYGQVRRLKQNASSVFHERFDAERVYGELADYLSDIARSQRCSR